MPSNHKQTHQPYNLSQMRTIRQQGNASLAIQIGKTLLNEKHNPATQALLYRECGHAWMAANHYEEARTFYRGALSLNRTDLESYQGLANALLALKQFESSVELLKKALQQWPQEPTLVAQLRTAANQIADWESVEWSSNLLNQWKRVASEPPWSQLSWNNSRKDQLLHATKLMSRLNYRKPSHKRQIDTSAPIKIAYLSADFRDHPVGHLTRTLFSHHDPNRIQPYAYVNGELDESIYQRSIHEAMHEVVRIENLNDEAVAEHMRSRGIDILVDCMGHTNGSRLGIGANYPTPIQISWLGYPGTTGAPWIDFLLVDNVVVPQEHYADYSERIHPFPQFYLPYDDNLPKSQKKTNRLDWKLPKDGFVYGVFNHIGKWNLQGFNTWCRILQRAPNSILWTCDLPQLTKKRILDQAKSLGIGPNRFVWAPRVANKADHLERLAHADLFLDTFQFNGHSSTLDALSVGVPVISVLGNTFATRVSGSALLQLELDDLCAKSNEDYQSLAIKIYQEPQYHLRIKARLLNQLDTSPIFKTFQYCKNLENCFLSLVRDYNERLRQT